MGRARKTINDVADEKLPKATNKAVDKIPLTINIGDSKIFHFRAPREECELRFRWAKVFAGIMGLVRLLF
jgi:hypothetical protein